MLTVVDYTDNIESTRQIFTSEFFNVITPPSVITGERIVVRGYLRTWVRGKELISIIEKIRSYQDINHLILSNQNIPFKLYSNVIKYGDIDVRLINGKITGHCVYIRDDSEEVYILTPSLFEVDMDKSEVQEVQADLKPTSTTTSADWGAVVLLTVCVVVILITCTVL